MGLKLEIVIKCYMENIYKNWNLGNIFLCNLKVKEKFKGERIVSSFNKWKCNIRGILVRE